VLAVSSFHGQFFPAVCAEIDLIMCAKEAAMVCVMVNFGGTMTHPIESRLAGLPELSRTALCDLWKEHFGTSPPTQLRRDLMIPILAHRIQERAFGSLSAGTQKRLRQLAEGFANHSKQVVMSKPSLKPGTRPFDFCSAFAKDMRRTIWGMSNINPECSDSGPLSSSC
jgi:hypothetical protein